MAKRRIGAKGHGAASDRPNAAARRAGGGTASSRSQKLTLPAAEPGERMRGHGGRSARGGGGFLSNAKGLAESVGETTRDAAESTLDAARGAAGVTFDAAKGAAGAVASRAQETASQVAGKVRQNPWPSLLIGAGATWLAIDAVRGRSSDEPSTRASHPERSSGEHGTMGQAVSRVARAGRAAGGQIEEFVRDRPLLAGAATLGLGVAVGMAMPSSVTENELLGEARETVVRRARDAAKGTMEKVRGVSESLEQMGPFSSGSSGRGSSRRKR